MIPGLKNTRAIESVRIAIGEKGESGKKLPTKLSHFIFTTTQKKDNRYLRDTPLTELFGGKPKKIPIMLLSDDIDIALPTFYAKYSRRGIKLRSDDGENWTVYNEDGTRTLTICDPGDCEFFKDKDVKPHAILTGVVDCDSVNRDEHLGEKLFKFRTTSWNTMHALVYEMNRIKDACGGHLAYLPLNLIVFPKMVRPKGSAGEVLAYIVSLEPRTSMADLRMHAAANAESLAKITHRDGALVREATRISDYEEETVEEQIDVAEEFYPESNDTTNGIKKTTPKIPDVSDNEDNHPESEKSPTKDTSQKTTKPKKKSVPEVAKPATEPNLPAIHELPKGKTLLPVTFPDDLTEYPIGDAFAINVIRFADTHYDVNGSGVWTDGEGNFYSNAKGFTAPPKCVHIAVVDAIQRFGADAVQKAYKKVRMAK